MSDLVFRFVPEQSRSGILKVAVYVIYPLGAIFEDQVERVGVLQLDEAEWAHLQPMLIHGNGLYQANEAVIEIQTSDSIQAYLEGV